MTQDDNPKFALRTWLIRLGMKGKGYKGVRKALLENLEGNSAFRKLPNDRGKFNVKISRSQNAGIPKHTQDGT